MKLYFSPTSPYARKCLVLAIEKNLASQVEFVNLSPWDNPDNLLRANPLCKVPALELDDGSALCDSPLILEYLDSLGNGPRLIPQEGPGRWETLQRAALADGILDAALTVVWEFNKRPEKTRHQPWVDRRLQAIDRTLDHFETEVATWPVGRIDAGDISVGCAYGYLFFRLADLSRPTQRPQLSRWFQELSARPSMRQTEPPQSA